MGTASAPEIGTVAKVGSGVGGLLSQVSPYVRPALAALGIYEGMKDQPGQQSTVKRDMDPRLSERLEGDRGLLASADAWFQANKATGQNDTMREAQERLRGLLGSQQSQQGLANMYGTSQGLLNGTWRKPYGG